MNRYKFTQPKDIPEPKPKSKPKPKTKKKKTLKKKKKANRDISYDWADVVRRMEQGRQHYMFVRMQAEMQRMNNRMNGWSEGHE